jgi:PAS domain S-box-containing protein
MVVANTPKELQRRLQEANARIRELEAELERRPQSAQLEALPETEAVDQRGEGLQQPTRAAQLQKQQEAESVLGESEERFRALADNIAQLAWMADGSGWIFWYNQRWFDYTGTSLAEMEGWGWTKVHHPDHVARVVEKVSHCFETGKTWEDTFPLRGKDGNFRWFLSRAAPIRDAAGKVTRWFGTNTDITAQLETEQALRRNEERLKSALTIARLGTWEYQPGSDLSYFDERSREIYGLEHQRAVTSPEVLDLIHPDDRLRVKGQYLAALDPTGTGHYETEYRLCCPDGSIRWVTVRGEVYSEGEGKQRRAVRAAGTLMDVTERKQSEEALEEAKELLEAKVRLRTGKLRDLVKALQEEIRQRKQAEQQLQTRASQLRALAGELTLTEQRERRRLGKILHDHLQQLLVGAKFRIAILARTGDNLVREAATEIEMLLGESIDISRSLTAELSPPILQEGGLQAGLEWLARWMRNKHALKVDLVTQDALPHLSSDVTALLFESLRELLFNAVKHAQVHSATVAIRQLSDKSLQIQVSDAGQGFDPESLTPSSEIGGGFGLFSIRERLGLIGGNMEIDTAPGAGTRIVLVVPMEETTAAKDPVLAAEATAALVQAPELTVKSGIPIRVLLADDHAVVRDGLARVLNQEKDIQIVGEATDGQEAVELARRLLPDVILMDVSMPRVNGVEATRLIHYEFPDIYIIGLSMFEETERAQAMRDAGAADYRTKSGSTSDLIAAVRAARPAGSWRDA